jgi:hypothetical protein
MREIILLRTFCLVSCFALWQLPARAQQPQIVAHVLDVKGTWKIDGQTSPITRGQALAKGARVIAVSNHPGDAISIVHEEDLSRQQIVCDASPTNPCKTPTLIAPPASSAPQATSQVATLVHAAFALLMGLSPATASQYAVTMTRSVPSEKIQEAVVPLSPDGTIVLPHSPGGIPVGQYALQITRSDSPEFTQQNATLVHGGVWQPIPFASPGLFHIAVRDAQDHAIANLMILVVKQDHADSAQQVFDATKSLADAWTGPNARTQEHEFLRALLLSESETQ